MKPPAFLGRIIYFITKPAILLLLRGSNRSYVLICYQDEIIITKNWLGAQNKWRLPGGGVHNNEDPKDAASREIFEELGLKIGINELKQLGNDPIIAKESYNYYLYQANLVSKPILKIDQKEILKANFVKISAAKDLKLSDELQIAVSFLT